MTFGEDMLARGLRDRGYPIVFGNLDEDPGYWPGGAGAAVVTNADDHAITTCILVVREQGF